MRKFLPLRFIVFMFLLVGVASLTAYGQDEKTVKKAAKQIKRDTATAQENRYVARYLVTPKNFNTVLNQKATFVMTGDKRISSFGDFIALDVSKPTATVNFSHAFYSDSVTVEGRRQIGLIKSVVSGNISAGTTDGVVELFSNSTLNTNARIRLTYSVFLHRGIRRDTYLSKLFYTGTEADNIHKVREAARKYFAQREKRDSLAKNLQTLRLDELQRQQEKALCVAQSFRKLKAPTCSDTVAYQQAEFDQRRIAAEIELFANTPISKIKGKYSKQLDDSLLKIDLNARWSATRFVWLDFFTDLGRQKNYVYDSTAAFANQIAKRNLTTWSVGAALNLFFERDSRLNILTPFEKALYRLQYQLGETSNIADLASSTVKTRTTTTGGKSTRDASQEVQAYGINEYRRYYYHSFRGDIYFFARPDKKLLIHPYAEAIYNFNHHPFFFPDSFAQQLYNVGLGAVVAFHNDEKKKSSTVNVEPYIIFRDLNDEYESGERFYRRAEIGIRTALPFALMTKQ